ncbi:hypothetical protein Y88_1837 [Novosphingobium nitrogenifigens DSM 19370]|uniref:Glyoxalase-like domain-containing protein n=1 Tax=Novosphingobium nitrogenifigens DSM 19370 TaxID=983920 RepID=F1Z3S0_9SPHN|nr:VOC family protein [Novosphingobium nitrogenifigens]EGD60756.1 hypothetical protein Y88_1837 [Novosphingobium nitrogenifigens DSM 19370]
MSATLSYVNVFAADIEGLSGFYRRVFDFAEIPEIRSPIFIGLATGQSNIGFNALDAYGLLQLDAYAPASGVKFLLNIDVADRAAVEERTAAAVGEGATLVKPPYETYYGWYQSVLLDPEGNVFRINVME